MDHDLCPGTVHTRYVELQYLSFETGMSTENHPYLSTKQKNKTKKCTQAFAVDTCIDFFKKILPPIYLDIKCTTMPWCLLKFTLIANLIFLA